MGKPDKKQVAQMVVLSDLGKSARQIGAEVGVAANTVTNYLRSSKLLDDPKVKELVAKMREHEADDIALLCGKARSILHQRLDSGKIATVHALAIHDRLWPQRRLLEGKATAHMAFKSILQIQQTALDLTVQHCSGNHEKCDPASCEEARAAPKRKDTGRPQTRRKRAATA